MEERIKISPDICGYVDENHENLFMEISIPGVKKEDINFKMHEDSFSLSAPRDDIEYVAALAFCCPVKPDNAEAKYNDGLLSVKIPFKDPMEDAVKIPIK